MKPHQWFILGAWLAALGVVNGAFAAHGLKERIAPFYDNLHPDDVPEGDYDALLAKRLTDYDTGVRYQMYHSLGLMIVGAVAARRNSAWFTVGGLFLFAGILLFSGMLYALVLTNRTMLGAVVPFGGVAFVLGWIAVSLGARKALQPAERIGTAPTVEAPAP